LNHQNCKLLLPEPPRKMKRKINQSDEGESRQEKRVKHDKTFTVATNFVTMLPRELMIEIFTFIPYRKLIRNISLVNHTCHDIILGDDAKSFWKQVCRHQSINCSVNTLAEQSFVTKYQSPSIKPFGDEKLNGIALEFIESFVTNISINKDRKGKFLKYFYECKERHIFPALERLDTFVPFNKLKKYFGTDLSRFKQLKMYQGNTLEDTSEIKFGSLEEISFHKCGETERYIETESEFPTFC
jgi:hypothetical protein